jgi:hypothetical protein
MKQLYKISKGTYLSLSLINLHRVYDWCANSSCRRRTDYLGCALPIHRRRHQPVMEDLPSIFPVSRSRACLTSSSAALHLAWCLRSAHTQLPPASFGVPSAPRLLALHCPVNPIWCTAWPGTGSRHTEDIHTARMPSFRLWPRDDRSSPARI